MTIGTKTVLYGVHQFAIHPWFVAEAWRRLYGFPWDPRLWLCFFLHDLGYVGKPNLDGPEGEQHPRLAAGIMGVLFDWWLCRDNFHWYDFCLYHSRFLAKKDGKRFSRLCVADKLAIFLTPAWLYLPMARATGELTEYMQSNGARTPAQDRTPKQWFADVQAYCEAWAYEHADCKTDTWTGTKRDLALSSCTCEPWMPTCEYCRTLANPPGKE